MTKVWEDSKGGRESTAIIPPPPRLPGLLIRHLNLAHGAAFHFGEPVVHERVRAGFAELHLNEPALRRVKIERLRMPTGNPVRVFTAPQQVAALLIHRVELRTDHVEAYAL